MLQLLLLLRVNPQTYSNLHITLGGVDLIKDGFHRHPLHRQSPWGLLEVDIGLVDVSSETKVRDLDDVIVTHKYVSSGQISVDELLL